MEVKEHSAIPCISKLKSDCLPSCITVQDISLLLLAHKPAHKKTTKSFIHTVLVAVFTTILTGLFASSAHSNIEGPGWFNKTGTPITHKQAQGYYTAQEAKQGQRDPSQGASSSLVTISAATTITPEITALARALQNDPKLIYEYVHNHIDYVPYFGSLKGATLTLLDRSGNDFDQASLMIALLRASDYTAQYIYGQIFIPNFGPADEKNMQSWLGVDPISGIISTVLASGGIPFSFSGSTTLMDRVWVKATINATDYLFDPALKAYQATPGIDLKIAMGYAAPHC